MLSNSKLLIPKIKSSQCPTTSQQHLTPSPNSLALKTAVPVKSSNSLSQTIAAPVKNSASPTKRSVGNFLKNSKLLKNSSNVPVLQTSIYDWDSPSSSTGTIKKRPSSIVSPTSPTVPINKTGKISSIELNLKLSPHYKKITTTATKSTKENSQLLSTIKSSSSEFLLENNLKGRTKNLKLQKFNQNNKLQQKKLKQHQQHFQQKSSTSRSEDVGNKKFIKNNIKTVTVDNDIVVNVDNNEDNNDTVIIDNDDNVDNVENVIVLSNKEKNNVLPKGISPSSSLNGSIKKEQQHQKQQQQKKKKFLTTTKISSLTNSKNNLFGKQKSKQFPLATTTTTNITIPNVSKKLLKSKKFPKNKENTNGDRNVKEIEITLSPSLQKSKTTTATTKTTISTKTTTGEEEKFIKDESIDTQQSENNLEYSKTSIKNENGELKTVEAVSAISKKPKSLESILNDCSSKDYKNYGKIEINVELCSATNDGTFFIENQKSEYCDITNTTSASNTPANQFNTPAGSPRTIDCISPAPIALSSPSKQIPKQNQTMIKLQPPPYRHPPQPPTPPPISQIPSLNKNHSNILNDYKRTRTLPKQKSPNKSTQNSGQAIKLNSSPTHKASHFNELKNCFSKLNSKFSLTSALSRVHLIQSDDQNSNNEITKQNLKQQQQKQHLNEYTTDIFSPTPCKEINKISPDDLKILNRPKFTSNQFKNIPVRQRKGPQISHLENYCLFDPSVDFINEKEQNTTPNCLTLEETKNQSNQIDLKNHQNQNLNDGNTLNLNFTDDTGNFPNKLNLNKESANDIKDDDTDSKNEYRINEMQHHNYFTIDPKTFRTDSTSTDANSNPNLISTASIKEHLQNVHVQDQFSSRYCNDSNMDIVDDEVKQSTLPPTKCNKRRVDFSNSSNVDDVADVDNDDYNNKHTHSIQITVNKDIISKNLQNEHSKKQHQQQQQQYKHYQQEQHLNDCTIKKGVDEIAQHNFFIHPMANVGHKMTIEEQKQILLHQHQEIPLNILLVNSQNNGVEYEKEEGQQKNQLEEQNYQKSQNISINSCHQHYHHYYNQNYHYQQQQQQYYLDSELNQHQQLQHKNQYENKIFVDSAHHQTSTTTTTLNNSKIHLNNNGSIKWITGKLVNGNNSIKPEVNKCLSTLNNCKYNNSNSINLLSKQKAIHHLRHSMDEIFSYSNSIPPAPNINLTVPNVNNSYKKSQLPLVHDDDAMQFFYTSELNLFNSIQGHSQFESDGKLNFPRKSNIQYKYGSESGYLGQIGGYKIYRSYNNQNHNHHQNKKTSRPLSIANNSDDGDSGFLSPNSPDYELKFNSDIFWDKIQKQILLLDKDESYDNIQGYIEIYTDWANYYLDRAKSKKRIIDLANDCCDGLLLADIIEIVTNFKVPNIIKNPKNHQQMHDNVLSCLTTLRTNSIDGTENITAHDICSGHLKAILTLFFALSRHKQQLKQKQKSVINSTIPIVELNNQISPTSNYVDYNNYVNYNENIQQQQRQKPQGENYNNHQQQKQQNKQQYVEDVNNVLNDNNMETIRSNWQKSSPYSKTNGTAIPLPATVLVQRRCPPDKVRPLPPTPNHVPSIPGLGKTGNSGSSSVNNSPINSHSHISLQSSPQKVAGNNGLRQPQCKIPSSPFTSPKMSGHSTITTTSSHTTSTISSASSDKPPPLPAANPPPQASKHSMLDKFKLFKTEKSTSSSNSSTKSERTSSSSGFSSARSEKSDSSSSLNHLPPVSTKLKPPSKGSIISNNENCRIKESISKKTTKQSSNTDKISTKQSKEKSPAKTSSTKDDKTTTKLQKSTMKNSNADQGKSSSKTSISDQNSKAGGGIEKKVNNGMVRSNSSNLSLNNTGIPKPMAAIKGQTKTVHINGEEKLITIVKDNPQKDISKNNCDSVGAISSQHPNTNSEQSKTHIVRPLPTHPHQHNGLNLTNGLTSCLKPTPIINGILKHAELEKNSSNSALVNVKNLKLNGIDPQTINEESNGNKSANTNRSPNKIGVNGSLNGGIGNSVQNSDLFEEEQPVSVTPMKPLLEGYNSHVTILPSRSNQKVQYLITEYGDIDLGQGYMSDGGESFRRVPVLTQRFLEIDNGYLSDGSVGSLGNQQQQLQQQQQQPLTPHRGKHFLNGLRGRQLLPTTIIEERVRGSRGSLDSIGGTGTQTLNSPTGSQLNTVTNNNYNNNNNNNITIECTSDNNSPKNNTNNNQINSDSDSPTNMESKCDSNPSSRSSSRIGFVNGRDTNNQKLLINGSTDQQQQQQNKLPTGELNTNQKIKSSQSKQSSSPSKTKGVPQSFGYIKRTNGSALGVVTTPASTILTVEQQKMLQQQQIQQQQQQQDPNRSTAHVSGVPRNGKIKVSGGTQTPQNDIQTKMPPTNQNRSFSLTGPGATQLSQAIRERLANGSYSLPKPGTEMHMFQHRVKYRHSGKILDGSLSDTQTYAEVKPEQSSYAMWLKHSNTTSSRLSAGDSIESLQHVLGSPAMQRHSAHKLIHRNSPSNQMLSNGQIVEAVYVQSPRLNRSNSIRSSKSDKMYSTLSSNQSGEVDAEPFYCLPVGSIQSQLQNGIIGGGNLVKIAPWSQPTSPTPPTGRAGLLSPTHSGISSSGYNSITPSHRLTYPKRNDDVHGSTASLLSGGSSLYGSVEERQANEVRRLKRELIEAKEQVMSLSSQLSTNAHVVSAFEQSLSNMKQRLHQLTETTERKDSELTDMRQTIELLRKQSIQAGLTSAHMQSMGLPSTQTNGEQTTISPRKQNCPENFELKKPTANGGTNLSNTNRDSATSNLLEVPENQTSRGSICSLTSITSVNSTNQDKKKKKSWLKSSFTKAFSKNAKISKTDKQASSSIPNTPQKVLQQRNSDATNLLQKQMLAAGGGLTEDPNNFLTGTNHNMETNRTSTDSTKSSPQKCVTIIENAKPLDAIDLDGNPVVEDLKKQLREKDLILTDIRLEALSSASQLENLRDTVMKMRAEMLSLKQNNDRLQKLVTSRSLAGSEISLRNSISPNGSIISDSKRYSLVDGTRPHIELPKSLEEEVEDDNLPPAPAPEPPPPTTLPIQTTSPTTHIDLTPPPPAIEAPSPTRSQPPMLPSVSEDVSDVTDGKKIEIAVYLGQPESFSKYLEEIIGNTEAIYSNTNFHKEHREAEEIYSNATTEMDERMYSNPNFHEFVIACTYISGKTTWQNLDYIVRKTFKDYLARIDPGTNLGLNTDSITSYHLGEAKRGPEIGFPQLLPCGYIIGTVKTLYICLQGVGSLAFDSLIPRSIVHRYITLLTEHRRLILCGPSGTGKSYLARKLAEFIVARGGRNNISEAIATFNVDNKSSKELRQFLSYIGEQASMPNGESELPSVIILDNLHQASALGDVFSSLLSAGPAAKLPCIIGTMSQATCNTTNLQLHHNFRWVLTANHMEPVKGFLGRYLKRRLYTLELHSQNHQPDLTAVFAWLPTVWQHINRFLEIHSSSDVTIGPRLFLSCPLNLKDSQVWFTDIWNYHIVPYLIEAVREGVQLYGRRGGAWNDPSTFIRDTYPWKYGPDSVPPLRQINAEDVGLEGSEIGKSDSHDPLLNMLMHLQEAANYSENQEPESDCVSLDSNLTQDSSVGVENDVE